MYQINVSDSTVSNLTFPVCHQSKKRPPLDARKERCHMNNDQDSLNNLSKHCLYEFAIRGNVKRKKFEAPVIHTS